MSRASAIWGWCTPQPRMALGFTAPRFHPEAIVVSVNEDFNPNGDPFIEYAHNGRTLTMTCREWKHLLNTNAMYPYTIAAAKKDGSQC